MLVFSLSFMNFLKILVSYFSALVVLIYIFEDGMKTFFLKWESSRSKSQFEKKYLKKTASFFFRLEAEFFWAHVES